MAIATVAQREPRQTAKLKSLTSLRFIAAAMIVVFHCQGYFGIPSGLWQSLGQGVSFFFVLSGFILTYVYPSLDGARNVVRFWVARIARIWPAHLASMLLVLALLPPSGWTLGPLRGPVAMANAFLIHAWIPYPDYFFSYNAPSWSISTELAFYLCFPLLLYRWKQTWRLKLGLAILLLICTVAACNWLHLPTAGPPFDQRMTATAFTYINPIGRLLEFVFGMSVALFWSSHRDAKLTRLTASLGEIGIICLIAFGLYLLRAQPASLNRFMGNAGTEYLLHSGCFWLFGALICMMAWGQGIISALLSTPAFVFLGEIGYSIYLLHQVLLRFYQVSGFALLNPKWIFLIAYGGILLGGSWLIWVVVEKPCRRMALSLADRHLLK